MSLRTIPLKDAYSSDIDDPLNEFYIPALQESIHYDRLSGFFSSQSLAIAARGITGLIHNDGSMRMIVSPYLNNDDIKVIEESYGNPEKFIENNMIGQLDNMESEFVKDHVFALGWMVANNKLDIKIAIPEENGKILSYDKINKSSIFHMKVGILEDSDKNTITFSGSINESAKGWLGGYIGHTEEFKVFKNWIPTDLKFLNPDIQKFERFWYGISKNVRTIDMPIAIKKRLIEKAPKDFEKINLDKWYKRPKKVKLYEYQEEAISKWFNHGMKGIFEMATGTGKTFTAIGCMEKIFRKNNKTIVIITCPYQHLINQWKKEIESYGIRYDKLIEADSTNPSWKNSLTELLIDFSIGYTNKLIILTTHTTFSSPDFINIIENNVKDTNLFLIADEMHGLGADKTRNGLLSIYTYRLGLSATPERYFDTIGTNLLYDYFNGIVYEFPLDKAIRTINPATGKTYLTPYIYIPKFVTLDNDELEEYMKKTISIAYKIGKVKKDSEQNELLQNLLFSRANIIKNANSKYRILVDILNDIDTSIKLTIIYTSPQQIDNVMDILKSMRIESHRFTMDEGTVPNIKYDNVSERDYILHQFADCKFKVLVAMKCLDEGVDIPPARTAILMASSGNPREYIQRIGRIIRRYNGKQDAKIYDIIVTPSFEKLPKELRDIELKIFKKELLRYEEIASIAQNNIEALNTIYDLKNKLRNL